MAIVLIQLRSPQQENCGICLDPYENSVPVVGHSRGHSFHESCFNLWIQACRARLLTCPICRISITSINGVPFQNQENPSLPVPRAINPSWIREILLQGATARYVGLILEEQMGGNIIEQVVNA